MSTAPTTQDPQATNAAESPLASQPESAPKARARAGRKDGSRHLASEAQVDAAAIAPLSGSRKIYIEGSRPDIRVPMREIVCSPTQTSSGLEENPPIVVYDTSGPTPTRRSRSTFAEVWRRCVNSGSRSAAIPNNSIS